MNAHVIAYRHAAAARHLASANQPGQPRAVADNLVRSAAAELLLAAAETH
jgi:hypothetical protein